MDRDGKSKGRLERVRAKRAGRPARADQREARIAVRDVVRSGVDAAIPNIGEEGETLGESPPL